MRLWGIIPHELQISGEEASCLGRQRVHLFPWGSANPLGNSVNQASEGSFPPPLQYLIRQYFPFYSCRSLYKAFLISLCAFVIWLSFPVWGFLLLSLWAFSNCPDSFLFLVDLIYVPVLMPFPSCFNSFTVCILQVKLLFMVSIPSFHWRFSSFSIFFWYVYIIILKEFPLETSRLEVKKNFLI